MNHQVTGMKAWRMIVASGHAAVSNLKWLICVSVPHGELDHRQYDARHAVIDACIGTFFPMVRLSTSEEGEREHC